jgi:hypothetical protein
MMVNTKQAFLTSQSKKRLIKMTVVLVVLFTGALFVGHFLFPPNKAQEQSNFITEYAKAQQFTLFRTAQDSGTGIDNRTPWYQSYYKTNKSVDAIKTSLEAVLRSSGYTVTDNYADPAPCIDVDGTLSYGQSCPSPEVSGLANNGGKPYWVVNGTSSHNKVWAEITNISYVDSSSDKNLYKNIAAQHPVPSGYNVLDVTVSIR